MANVAALTPELARLVRDLVRKEQARANGERIAFPKPSPNRREHLWAKTPEDGIPARDGLQLGVADCELYTDSPDAFGADPRSLVAIVRPGTDVAVSEPVYNGATTAIGGSSYVQIERTNGGAWRVPPESSYTPTGFFYSYGAYSGWEFGYGGSSLTIPLYEDGINGAGTHGWTVDETNDEFVCEVPGEYTVNVHVAYIINDSTFLEVHLREQPEDHAPGAWHESSIIRHRTWNTTSTATPYDQITGHDRLTGSYSYTPFAVQYYSDVGDAFSLNGYGTSGSSGRAALSWLGVECRKLD